VEELPSVFRLGVGEEACEPLKAAFDGEEKEAVVPPRDHVVTAPISKLAGWARHRELLADSI